MHIFVVAVDEIYSFVATQVVEGLFHRQSILAPELKDEDHRPFQFVLYIVFHVIFL